MEKPDYSMYEGATAIISDPHANDNALDFAIKDIDAKGIKRIVCLGDIVGYGNQITTIVDNFRTACL